MALIEISVTHTDSFEFFSDFETQLNAGDTWNAANEWSGG